MMGEGMGSWMFANMFFWVLIIAGVIFLIVWFTRKGAAKEQKPIEESVLDILKKRYAKGEINKEEFEERKKELL